MNRSLVAKRAWEIRRARAKKAKRSAAAKKGAATRQKNREDSSVWIVRTVTGTFNVISLNKALGKTGKVLTETPLIASNENWVCYGNGKLAETILQYKGVLACRRPGESEILPQAPEKSPPNVKKRESTVAKISGLGRKMSVSREEIDMAQRRVGSRKSCREVHRSRYMHVVEYPPQIRVCKFNLHCQNSQRYLAMPFMQFTRYLGKQGLSLHVSFTNEPLRSIRQEVYFPLLPNIWYPSLQVCLMSVTSTDFAQVVRNFWNTRYLDCEDWYCFPVIDRETPMRTHQKWERLTKEDPTFILDVKWTHSCRLDAIPQFDVGGNLSEGTSGKPEYGGTPINRKDGPIRGFAVYGCRRESTQLD